MICFDPTDDERAIREEVRRFAEQEMRARGREGEKARAAPEALRRTYREMGLATLEWPEALGGLALSPVARAIVEEELARGDAGLAVALDGPGFAAVAIQEMGSEEQRARWLGRLAGPDAVAALALAEGDLGSEIGRVATTATPDGEGGFRIDGRKLFVLNGPAADLFVVLARLAGGAGGEAGVAGSDTIRDDDPSRGALAAFVVEKGAPGLSLGAEDDRIGLQAARSCAVALDGVRVPGEAKMDVRETALDRFLARCWVVTAARQTGVARAAAEYAASYAKERTAFGRPIGSFQGIAFKVADMAIDADAARWLTWRAAVSLSKGRPEGLRQAALALVHANEAAVSAGIECVQVLGGAGFMEDYPAEKWMRDARALAAIGGADPLRRHLAAEREYGPESAAAEPDPAAVFAALGQAFGGG